MLGIGVIGTGSIANQHIKSYNFFKERCQILALYARNREKALEKKKEFLLDAIVYTDYKELLKNPDVNLVSICLPPFLHCQVAIDCMLAGKHVLVEKPMAPTLEECDEMIRVQREMGCYLGVISQNRYTKDNFFLKSMIEHGKLGSVFMGEVKSCWYRGESYYLPQWRGTWELEGGGCVLNHSIHQIDLLNWILGKPCEVYAVTANLNHPNSEVEDLAAAILQYSNDVVVTLNTSLISHGEEQLIRIQGSTASLSAPFAVECNIQREDGFPMVNEKYKEQLKREYEEMKVIHYTGFLGQIAEVLETIESGKFLGESAIAGRDAVEVATAIYASASLKRPVQLPLNKTSIFYKKGRKNNE